MKFDVEGYDIIVKCKNKKLIKKMKIKSPSEKFNVRQLTPRDILAVHKLYNSLSNESKQYYSSVIYGKPRHPIWFLAQIALIISCTPLRELILHTYSKYIYFIVGAFNHQNDLVGFCSICVHDCLSNGKLIARLGIAVKDNYQSKGVGSKLMEELLFLAMIRNVGKIYLEVISANVKAVRLYQKYGFEIVGIQRNAGYFKGEKCDRYKMELNL